MDIDEIKSQLSLKHKFNRDVSFNLLSLAVLGLCGIVINIFIAKYRGSSALGIFNQVYAIYVILSQIAGGGIQLSALKHTSYNQTDNAACSEIASSALVLTAMCATTVCIPSFLASNQVGAILNSDSVELGLKLAIPGLLPFSLNKVSLNVLNGMRKMGAFAFFQSLRFVLILLGVILIIKMGLPDAYIVLSLSVTELLLFFALAFYVNRHVKLRFSSGMSRWFREHLSFGGRGMLSGIFTEMNTRVDVLMLGFFRDDKTVGIYSLAAILIEGLSQLHFVIRKNVEPVLGGYFAEGGKAKITSAARKVRRIFLPLMVSIGLVSVALYPYAVRIFVADKAFSASFTPFVILITGLVLSSGYRPFSGIILIGGRPGLYSCFILSLVLGNAALNAVLIPLWGMNGAAAATASVFLLEALFVFVLLRFSAFGKDSQ